MDTIEINNETLRYGRVNTVVGTLQMRTLSSGQLLGGLSLILLFAVLILFFGVPLSFAIPVFGICLVIFLVWGGSDYTEELEKWHSVRSFYSESVEADESRPIPPPLFEGPHDVGEKANKKHKWERHIPLRGVVSYEKDRSKPGLYILEAPTAKRKIHTGVDAIGQSFYALAGFKVSGFYPSMTDDEAMNSLIQSTELMQSLPGVEFKFYWDCQSTAQEYIQMQKELYEAKEHDPLSAAIIEGRALRGKRLEKAGQISNSELRIYARKEIILGGDYTEAQGWKDRWMAKVWPVIEGVYKFFAQEDSHANARHWEDAIDAAYLTCYQPVFASLSNNIGLGLEIKPFTVDDLFEIDWGENHETPASKCPRYTEVSKRGLRYVKIDPSNLHLSSILFCPESEQGGAYQPAIPVFSQTSYYSPLRKKWAGCIRLEQQVSYPKDDHSYAKGHMLYLWNRLQGVKDFRVITETVSVDPVSEVKSIKDKVNHRQRRVESAIKDKHTQDFTAANEMGDLIDAGAAIEAGDRSINVGTLIWLFRDTEVELDEDLRSLATERFSGETSKICQTLVEDRYLESLPYSWNSLLYSKHNRRQEYLASQVVPLVPIVQPQSIDKPKQIKLNGKDISYGGLLFTGRGIPQAYYLDLLFKKNHTGIFAKSGGGKSMILLEIILECIFYGVPALVRDSPRGTGESTFTPLVNNLKRLGVKCEYHDIRTARFNLIGFPPGPLLPPDIVRNHIGTLKAIVVGTGHNPLADTIEAILNTVHRDFFRTVNTQTDRPILEDFYKYFLSWTQDYKQNQFPEQKEVDAISDIKIQLKGCLDSDWGQRLNTTEMFDPDLQLLVLGLTNAEEGSKETLIYAMASADIMDNMSARHSRAVEINDECSTIIKFDAVAQRMARRASEGRKMGINLVMAATDVNNFWASPHSGVISANFDNVLVGLNNEKYRENFVEKMGFKKNILAHYNKEPDKRLLKSSWYLLREDSDDHVEVEYGTTPLMLAIGATETIETDARDRVIAGYDDPLEGFKAFALELAKAYSQGLPASVIQ